MRGGKCLRLTAAGTLNCFCRVAVSLLKDAFWKFCCAWFKCFFLTVTLSDYFPLSVFIGPCFLGFGGLGELNSSTVCSALPPSHFLLFLIIVAVAGSVWAESWIMFVLKRLQNAPVNRPEQCVLMLLEPQQACLPADFHVSNFSAAKWGSFLINILKKMCLCILLTTQLTSRCVSGVWQLQRINWRNI